MHPLEPKAAFVVMRANGWSLGKISEKLEIPRSTLFEWGGELQKEIHVVKCFQLEKLQERYIPSFEEELEQTSTYLARVERALQKHDFDNMRPEFLLHTAMQLRSRLHEFRNDASPNVPIEQAGLKPVSIAGCISRSEEEVPAATQDDSRTAFEPGETTTPSHGHHLASLNESSNGKLEHANRTNPDKNGGHLESDHSNSTTYNGRDHALVRFTPLERRHSCRQNSEALNVSDPSTATPTNNETSPEENRTNPDKNGAPEKLEH